MKYAEPLSRAAGSPLRVTGPVTLEEVSRWRDTLGSALAESDLSLDLEGSGPWDVAGLQLVLSALLTATKVGKPLSLHEVPGAFLTAAEAAGCTKLLDRVIIGRDV